MNLKFTELQKSNEREIRCILVQGINKKIKVYYDNFEEVKDKLFSKIVTIYEPNEKQRDMISDLIKVEDEEIANISSVDFLVKLIPELTDIDFDLDINNQEDLKKISEILNHPTKLLKRVHSEITEICTEIFDELLENLKSFADRPLEVQEAYFNKFVKEKEEVKEETKENEQ